MGFDYEFNLAPGKKYTNAALLFEVQGNIIDQDTKKNIFASSRNH